MTAAAVSGETLYAGFWVDSCVPRNCSISAGVFRTSGGAAFEHLLQNDANVLLAPHDSQLYWVRDGRGGEPLPSTVAINAARIGTTSSRNVGTFSHGAHVSGIAVASGDLFSLSASSELSTTALERRPIGSDGSLGAPELLQRIAGSASRLATNGSSIGWTEPTTTVVADLTGQRRLEAPLPSDTVYRVLKMTDRFSFTLFERRKDQGPSSYSIIALDLATGEAKVAVSARLRIMDMAATSTHLLWVELSDAASFQVWAQPVPGGTPHIVACDTRPITDIAASDEAVYWVADEVHRLDAKAL